MQEVQVWIQTLRTEEVKALQDKVALLHQNYQNTSPKISQVKAGGRAVAQPVKAPAENTANENHIARVESNFSFNYSAQRSLLYEEIEILREQATQYVDSYQRATQSRDTQFQILAKERNILRHREQILDAALSDAIEIM